MHDSTLAVLAITAIGSFLVLSLGATLMSFLRRRRRR
jgi:hypothetical protein